MRQQSGKAIILSHRNKNLAEPDLSIRDAIISYTVKKIRKIYGRITGNQLPVPEPLFLREPIKVSHMAGQDKAR